MRIGVLTGGGDVPGLNAAIRAAAIRCDESGHELIGIPDGWKGLIGRLPEHPLTGARDRTMLLTGGTILGSSRTNPIKEPHGPSTVRQRIEELRLDALVAIGGDDTLSVAATLAAEGVHVVGAPKTMDFDLNLTEYCIGFDTAVSIATEALDRLATTAASHSRILVLEVMGREAGWVALYAGTAGGADAILLPEFPVEEETIMHRVEEVMASRGFCLIVASEGFNAGFLSSLVEESTDAFGHARLARRAIGERLADRIGERTGTESRGVTLGHVQRGGLPTSYDRYWATRVGTAAIDFVEEGAFGSMPVVRNGEIASASIADVCAVPRLVPRPLYEAAHRILR